MGASSAGERNAAFNCLFHSIPACKDHCLCVRFVLLTGFHPLAAAHPACTRNNIGEACIAFDRYALGNTGLNRGRPRGLRLVSGRHAGVCPQDRLRPNPHEPRVR